MAKFDGYIAEYMAVVEHLLKKIPPEKRQHFLLVDKTELCKMLDRNAYEPASRKLKIWRDLHWIEADRGHMTWRVVREGRRIRMVKINLQIYHSLQLLLSE